MIENIKRFVKSKTDVETNAPRKKAAETFTQKAAYILKAGMDMSRLLINSRLRQFTILVK